MISLRVLTTNLVNKNRTLVFEVFPNRKRPSNELYTLLFTVPPTLSDHHRYAIQIGTIKKAKS